MSLLHITEKVIPIIGTLSFLASIIFPFLNTVYAPLLQIPERLFCKIQLWSFRGYYECFRSGGGHTFSEAWFYDFWFKDQYVARYELSWPFTFLFIAQILTLSAVVVSIFTNRRIFALLPTISCPLVTVLMIHLYVRFSGPPFGWVDYMQGYWLTYLSEVIFITNFLLKRRLKTKKSLKETERLLNA